MKKRIVLLSLAVLVMMGLNGCISAGGPSPLQRDVEVLKQDVAALKGDRNISADLGGRERGSLAAEIGQLRTEVQRLTDNMDMAVAGQNMTLGQQLEYLGLRLDRLEKKAGLARLSPQAVGSPGAALSPPDDGGAPVIITPGVNAPLEAGQAPVTGQADAPSGGKSLSSFEEGKRLYDQRNYDAALIKFRAQVTEEPKSGQAAAAQFYIGECLSAQKKYEEAILEYQKVIQNYAKSSQVPSALLKQGAAFQSLNDAATAKLLYQKVVREHPKSYAAGVAKERLKTM